ncbi:lovastatin diketide synthase LovF-like [Notothenia coriiceps]|uniref:Lovastatin diketide synthase LovF-like n=1 Tax=Notothenia coriiceps TaxID=8208 RepID=A0A6I9MNA7_9TELE|nr:PREDICTED: lovastatin diketide synthase LovF-like [Notothenia coriiceps]
MEDANDDIAVIGIGCNFPGGEGLDNFWKVLLEGKNCVVDIPTERFDTTFWYDADESKPGKTQTTKAALIEGFNEFDHRFFGITEVEADFMDPQQKLLLQCTYRALEDAGIAMESISGTRTGVYMGLMNRDYEILQSNSPTTINHYNGTGTAMSVAANRISFTFNLTGPSFAVDSACSSSLVVLHLACQAIKQGDCEMALCGGVSCILEPRVFVALSKAKMISPEGTSKPFSSRADGYGRGEGCGVVLLKPLKKAIKDCNRIWGIISKTAVNQDGHSVTPITKPSMTQQEELLRNIYSESDLANVQYIEAHGTGTPVGDPTEAGSISNVIAKAKPPGSEMLWIGSVKGNIGHTESAAGVAGLIKVGIAALLKHWGIKPDAVLGHSVGEVAAAHCSGLLSLEDAVKVLHHRRDADSIAILHEKLKIMFAEKNLFLHELDVPAAYHSHMMDPILDDIETSINPLYAKNKECKLFSTVTGAFFVELAYASAMASLRPKKPVSLLQLSVRFENLFALSSNSHQLKVTLEPVAATAKVIIPEAVCYSTKQLPILKETPCVSYFILAWEILQRMLSKVEQQHRKLIIISPNSASALMKVLALSANRETFQLSRTNKHQTDADDESYFTTKTVQQVVLDQTESHCPVSDIPFLPRSGRLFKQSCVYIVTGGLSGLGLETVKFIAHNAGGCIATLSRSALTDEIKFEMEVLQRRYGVTVMNVQCDVSVSTQVLHAISMIKQRFHSCPIKGVFHSAAVLHDALIENLDESLFRKVLQPKVCGALNLHYATLHNKLDFFVCYSSISSFIGNASQCNYAAANSFLDSFCHYRRNLGLAGQSINWGPLNLGLLLNKDNFQQFLEAKGMMVMDVCYVQKALETCLVMNRPQQVICKFNFKNLHIHVLSQNASLRERLSALVEMEFKDYLNNEPRVQHLSSPHESVRRIVSDISNVSVEELDDDSTLCGLGIDSMLAMTLQNKIFQETGVNVPLVKILDPNSTLATLAGIVMNG